MVNFYVLDWIASAAVAALGPGSAQSHQSEAVVSSGCRNLQWVERRNGGNSYQRPTSQGIVAAWDILLGTASIGCKTCLGPHFHWDRHCKGLRREIN